MEPSNSNPFSAAAVSGGRLPYLFAEPSDEQELLQRLDQHQWIGQIVGAHGSGKTTLTHHLWKHAKSLFPALVQVTIRGGNQVQRQTSGEGFPRLFVVDGIERLSRVNRWLFLGGFSLQDSRHRNRAGQGDGLLVTGHRRLPWLPVVFKTSFDEVSLNRLTKELLPIPFHAGIPDGDGDFFSEQHWGEFSSSLLQRHGSNGREILMEMYDLYEEKLRKQVP